jgi:hypothetical protein
MERSTAAPKAPDVAPSDWLVWQLLDSGLPTGGFAHSCGLEAAMQLGEYYLKVRHSDVALDTSHCNLPRMVRSRRVLPFVSL